MSLSDSRGPGEGAKRTARVDPAAPEASSYLPHAEIRRLLCSIETDTEEGLRDLAMLGLMIHGFVRAGVLPGLRVADYERNGLERRLRLHADAAEPHSVPVHHQAAAYLDAYLNAAGIADDREGPLFRSASGCRGLRARLASGGDVLSMVRRRARRAGLTRAIGLHTLRASGIAQFLDNGGTIEHVKAMAGFRNDRGMARYIGRAASAEPGAKKRITNADPDRPEPRPV